MQRYKFAFSLKGRLVPVADAVLLNDLREAHRYGIALIGRTLAEVEFPTRGWILTICDGADQPLLYVIVPASPTSCGDVRKPSRDERARAAEWAAAMARLRGVGLSRAV